MTLVIITVSLVAILHWIMGKVEKADGFEDYSNYLYTVAKGATLLAVILIAVQLISL